MGTPTATPTGRRRAELWVRASAPPGIERDQHALADRVAALAGDEPFADCAVRTWPSEITLSQSALRSTSGQIVLERLAAIRAWAERNGRELAPSFETRVVDATITGETYTSQVLPVRALVEYDGDRVCHVTPHVGPDGELVAVRDRIARLEAERRGSDPIDEDRLSVEFPTSSGIRGVDDGPAVTHERWAEDGPGDSEDRSPIEMEVEQ